MRTRAEGRSGRSTRNWLSLALFGLAAVLFIVVAVIWFRDRNEEEPPPPTAASVPGKAILKNVVDAVRAQGVAVAYSATGARSDALTQPGQGLTADGNPLYVFIYEDPAAREGEATGLEPVDLDLVTATGTPIARDTLHTIGGSNVYVILVGGDADLVAKVDRAIQGLP